MYINSKTIDKIFNNTLSYIITFPLSKLRKRQRHEMRISNDFQTPHICPENIKSLPVDDVN